MKDKHKINCLIGILLIGMASCEKTTKLIDENTKTVYLDTLNTANVKVVQLFAGNTPTLPTAATTTQGPQVFIYANGQKLTGASIGYGGVFPTTANYANLPAGSTRFDVINGRINLNVVPNVPSFIAGDTLATLTTNLEKGKTYSLYLTDTVPTMRFVIKEDVLISPNEATFKLRVANFFMNNVPTDTVSLFSVLQNAEIIKDVTHKNVSDWVELPITILADSLIFRKKGTTTPYVTPLVFSGSSKRMYTIVGRGKLGVVSKTPSMISIINR